MTVPHDGQFVRAGTTGNQHHGRSYHRSTTGTGTTETVTTGVQERV